MEETLQRGLLVVLLHACMGPATTTSRGPSLPTPAIYTRPEHACRAELISDHLKQAIPQSGLKLVRSCMLGCPLYEKRLVIFPNVLQNVVHNITPHSVCVDRDNRTLSIK